MKITYIGHAGLWIETKDCNIICDPWKHENPQFFQTWYVYPDNSNLDWDYMINNVDFLYVSHIHRDHLDSIFLKQLSKRNKNVVVILPNYRYCQLKNDLKNIGFKNFLLKEGKYGDTEFTTYPAETIDREREDSSLLVNDGKTTFLNLNDSTITDDHKKDIFSRFSKIDMMAAQFSGANWWPLCYNYKKEELEKMCVDYKNRKITDYLNLIDYLNVKKIVNTAGPPCFLDQNLYHFNSFDDNPSIFFDGWQIPEFDTNDKIYRVIPGDTFTCDTIIDRKQRPSFSSNKREFIITHHFKNNKHQLHENNDEISQEQWNKARDQFISWMENIIINSKWLKEYIHHKIYISVLGYKTFCLDFRKHTITEIDKISRKGAYYIVSFPAKMFYQLVTKNYTDWEQAFLSCKCKFERFPDKYNPWILSFFRNLKIEQLDRIYQVANSKEVKEGVMTVGEYEVNRYCPHQQYDLLHHSKINLEENTIQCLGHGWKWDLKSGEGINCSCKLKCKKIK